MHHRDRLERLRWQGDAQDRHRSATGRHWTRRRRPHVAADTSSSSSSQRTCQCRARSCSFPGRRACWKRPMIASTTRARCSRRSSSGARWRNSTLPTHPPFGPQERDRFRRGVTLVLLQGCRPSSSRTIAAAHGRRLTIWPRRHTHIFRKDPIPIIGCFTKRRISSREKSRGSVAINGSRKGWPATFRPAPLGDGGCSPASSTRTRIRSGGSRATALRATRPATRRRSSLFPSKCC